MKNIKNTAINFISVFLIIVMFTACNSSSAIEQIFSTDDFSITLTSDFSEDDIDNAAACFKSNVVIIVAEKFEFNNSEKIGGLSSDSTIYDFSEYIVNYNYIDAEDNKLTEFIKADSGKYIYSTYVNDINSDTYKYYMCLFKSSDAFWSFYFCCSVLNAESCETDILKWADSVEFTT